MIDGIPGNYSASGLNRFAHAICKGVSRFCTGYDHHMTIIWPSYDRHQTVIWPSYDDHQTQPARSCFWSVVIVCKVCWQNLKSSVVRLTGTKLRYINLQDIFRISSDSGKFHILWIHLCLFEIWYIEKKKMGWILTNSGSMLVSL